MVGLTGAIVVPVATTGAHVGASIVPGIGTGAQLGACIVPDTVYGGASGFVATTGAITRPAALPIGTGGPAATGFLAGPIGGTVLGTKEDQVLDGYTFDCWKPVLHDNSIEPSNGKILREIAMDPRIKQVTTINNDNNPDLPYLILQNIWDEEFRVEYIYLPSGQLAAHAVKT